MDLIYPPDAEEFRGEIRAWLEEKSARRLVRRRVRDDVGGAPQVPRGVDAEALRRRMDLRIVAEGVRRQGSHDHAERGAERGVRARRGAAAGRLLRRHARRPDDPAMGEREAEAGVPPEDPVGTDLVVSGLQRARRRLRPRGPQDQGRARRRRVGHQRSEDLDDASAVRRLHLPARAHRPDCAEARGHQLPPRADEAGGHRGAADRPARRFGRVQRGVLHQRALRRRRTSSAGSTTAGRWR